MKQEQANSSNYAVSYGKKKAVVRKCDNKEIHVVYLVQCFVGLCMYSFGRQLKHLLLEYTLKFQCVDSAGHLDTISYSILRNASRIFEDIFVPLNNSRI